MRVSALPMIACFALAGCGSDNETTTADAGLNVPDARAADAGSTSSGGFTHYVSPSLKLGKTSNEAYGYAFDLDGDGQEDDQIGGLLALLASNLDADGRLDAAVKAGTIILLHSLRADSLTSDSTVNWRVLVGSAKPNPDYTGSGSF